MVGKLNSNKEFICVATCDTMETAYEYILKNKLVATCFVRESEVITDNDLSGVENSLNFGDILTYDEYKTLMRLGLGKCVAVIDGKNVYIGRI